MYVSEYSVRSCGRVGWKARTTKCFDIFRGIRNLEHFSDQLLANFQNFTLLFIVHQGRTGLKDIPVEAYLRGPDDHVKSYAHVPTYSK